MSRAQKREQAPRTPNARASAPRAWKFAQRLECDGLAVAFLQFVLIAAGLLMLCPASAHAQGGVPLWTNVSSGGASGLAVDSRGNVLVTGSWWNGSNYDSETIKYSNTGVPLWTNRYGGPSSGDDYPRAIAVDGAGNVFVTGSATIAYANSGTPLWTNRFPDGAAVAVDSSGNVFVTGNSGNGNSVDIATIKYSNASIPLWTNHYVGPANTDLARAIAVDSGGNVFVTGVTFISTSPADHDYVTIKYSTGGELLWINYYDGPDDASGNSYDEPWSIAVDSSGNVFVTGISKAANGYTDYATVAYSSAGAALWTNRYDGPANSEEDAAAVAVDSNGNVFVTGSSVGTGNGIDYATIKYSNAGVPLWIRRYNGPANNNDNARAIAVDSAGNVFVTGESYGANGSSSDYATVAYSNSGVVLWTKRYNRLGNGYDSATAIALDHNGNVFVAGSATIKYSSSVPPPRLDFQTLNNELVLSWTNAGFNLQSAPAIIGPFTNFVGATSPYTNVTTGAHQFFRLKQE